MASKDVAAYEMTSDTHPAEHSESEDDGVNRRNTWQRLVPVIACGAGLFSDGYLNNVGKTNQVFESATEDTNFRSSAQSRPFLRQFMVIHISHLATPKVFQL